MAADTLCVCPMATWLQVCRSVIIIITCARLINSSVVMHILPALGENPSTASNAVLRLASAQRLVSGMRTLAV